MSVATLGKTMILAINGSALAESQSFTVNASQKLGDITSRDSNSWREVLPSTREWSIDFDGLFAYTNVAQKMLVHHIAELTPTPLTVLLTLPGSAGTFSGSGYLSSIKISGGFEEAIKFSGSIQGTSTLTQTVS